MRPHYDSSYMNNMRVSKNFSLKEFQCPCCGRVMLDARLLSFLQTLRNQYGQPIIITSGYRCEIHNIYIGGREDSLHLEGRAADFTSLKGYITEELMNTVEQLKDEYNLEIVFEQDHYHVEVP